MEAMDESEEESVQGSPEPTDTNADNATSLPRKPGSKAQGRKRTKTGCLTCRKRRIKCGEERPTCSNCTKSKRQCEGYNQRVVFKDPLNSYRPSYSGAPQPIYPSTTITQSAVRHGQSLPKPGAGHLPLPIAPKPPVKYDDVHRMGPQGYESRDTRFTDSTRPIQVVDRRGSQAEDKVQLQERPLDTDSRSHVLKIQPQQQVAHYDFNALVKQESGENQYTTPTYASHTEGSAATHTPDSLQQPHPYSDTAPSSTTTANPFTAPAFPATQGGPSNFASKMEFWKGKQKRDAYPPRAPSWGLPQPMVSGRDIIDPMEDDGPYDVSDDEEDEDILMEEDDDPNMPRNEAQDTHLRKNDLGIVVALQAGQDSQALRSFVSFINAPDMLATYLPSSQSTPLRDQMTARIFCHFVNVTSPCMSMYERNQADPSLIFRGTPVSKSQQHIWAYTFPTLALQNPGLLHAMLALGSLHIEKLQGVPSTASYKHYALSLRRVARSVSLHSRRGHPATLAASMLLAFYECWSADHQKWSNHLFGAKQLVKEIDFAGLTSYIRNKKAQQQQEAAQRYQHAAQHGLEYEFDGLGLETQRSDDVDENLIGVLMGRKVTYDQYGQIIDESRSQNTWSKEYTERDLVIYETQRDLFWWFCKQDTYQAILGGGRPFLEYSFMSYCPPRAPMGRLNAVYGTFDHMILLLGRLANFAAKDLKRKRLAMRANGGRWQPPESMRAQFPQPNPAGQSPQTPPQMPNFSGMVPEVKEAQLPMGFEPTNDASPQSTQSDEEIDLQLQTNEALEDWQEIRDAFDVIESHFGEDYQALGPEFFAPMQTPFGAALRYRTYSIAGIWMNLYMGLITCYRAHPSMPPAAIMAAGITARQTAGFANELGRIAAGIAPDCSMTREVAPGVGAALIESSTCLFVSAIQYQDAAQRTWTISRLRDIARLTGWQTALAVATGCETSWIKMGELGKGPKYTRSKDERVVEDIWTHSRRIDRAVEGKTNEERKMIVEKTDRVQYALGVIGLEQDFEGLDIASNEQ